MLGDRELQVFQQLTDLGPTGFGKSRGAIFGRCSAAAAVRSGQLQFSPETSTAASLPGNAPLCVTGP